MGYRDQERTTCKPMKSLTFTIIHKASDSRAFIECAIEKNKARIKSVGFAKGNVISLEGVRLALEHAEDVLILA